MPPLDSPVRQPQHAVPVVPQGSDRIDRRAHSLTDNQLADLDSIENSGLFDAEWYLQNHLDVARNDTNPLIHYILYGADEGRDPTRRFITRNYHREKRDTIPPGRNPFAYFILNGGEDDLFDRGLLTAFNVPRCGGASGVWLACRHIPTNDTLK